MAKMPEHYLVGKGFTGELRADSSLSLGIATGIKRERENQMENVVLANSCH